MMDKSLFYELYEYLDGREASKEEIGFLFQFVIYVTRRAEINNFNLDEWSN